jgi:hypothetical protein
MAISETDLKLLKSERMTDFADGGGKMTANEVVDGQVNNLFNDISQLDRTYGRVSLRKAYAAVQTANTDTYLGAHIILTDPPDDPAVNVTLFSTESWTDTRDAARNRIESYSISGPESPWILFGDHVVGQKMLLLWSRTNALNANTPTADESPEIGDIMLLSVEKSGFAAEQQFIRLTKIVSRVTSQFTDETGSFYKDVLTVEISNPLRVAFKGTIPSRRTLPRNDTLSSPTLVRKTQVADAAEYYGVKAVTEALSIGDLTIQVGSPYAALVPSAQAETPLVDIPASLARPTYVQTGADGDLTASATLSGTTSPDYAANFYMGRAFMPNSLKLTIGGTEYKDANGALVLLNGQTGTYTGVVDNATGQITIQKASSWSGVAVSCSAAPAVAVYEMAGTILTPVTVNNRAFNWVQTLQPPPSPGALTIDYSVMGKWYRLSDDGNGHINGIVAGIGTGTVDYATGAVLVTLAALPDINSAIIYAWSTPNNYQNESVILAPPGIGLKIPLTVPAGSEIKRQSLTVTWLDGTTKTAACNAAGVLSGQATGKLVKGTVAGEYALYVTPTALPASGTVFNVAYDILSAYNDNAVAGSADGNGIVTLTLPHVPVTPGSVTIKVPVQGSKLENLGGSSSVTRTITFTDNGSGKLTSSVGTFGTIDYTTGLCKLAAFEFENYAYQSGVVVLSTTTDTSSTTTTENSSTSDAVRGTVDWSSNMAAAMITAGTHDSAYWWNQVNSTDPTDPTWADKAAAFQAAQKLEANKYKLNGAAWEEVKPVITYGYIPEYSLSA